MGNLISVIVPVYNVAPYLDGCVKSIVSQTYSALEIILVDDGSTDASGALCDGWKDKDDRIKVIHKKNGGLSDARNAGIAIASGTYFMFVDSDDTITPDAVGSMYEAAQKYNCEIAVCNMMRIYDDGETEPFYVPAKEETLLAGNDRFKTLSQPSACNKLFLASLFREVRFPKGKFYEDTFVYHKLALQAKNIVLTGKNGYFYLSRRDSILGAPRFTDRYFDFIEAVHSRATELVAAGVPYYGEEACLSLYAAVSDGEKYLKRTPQNAEKFYAMRKEYEFAYRHLMSRPDTGMKQKLRLVLLRYFPRLHSKLYN